MMQQIDSVIRELQSIVNALPRDKKYASLRDAFKAFGVVLEDAKEQKVLQNEDLAKFLKAVEKEPNQKVLYSTFSLLQLLFAFKIIENVASFVETLDFLKHTRTYCEEDTLQIKLSSLVTTLIDKKKINCDNSQYFEKLLFIVLDLVENRNPMIALPIQSYLETLIDDLGENHLFQQCPEESKQANKAVEENSFISKFLVDLSFVIDQQRPQWYPPTTNVNRLSGLKWFNKIILSFGDLVFSSLEIIEIFKCNFMPAVKKILQQYQPPISQEILIEIFKSFLTMINGCSKEFFDLIEIFRKYVEHSENNYCKTLSMESLIFLVQNGYLLSLLLGNDFEKGQLVQILVAFSVLVKQMDSSNCSFQVKIPKCQHMEGKKEELPQSDPAIMLGMISEFLLAFSKSLVNYFNNSLKDKPLKEDYRNFIKQLEGVWRYCFQTLKSILERQTCEAIESLCLDATTYYIQVLGEVFNRQGQQEFINLLCEQSKQKLLAQQSLLKVLQKNGGLIDANGWVKILTALFHCELLNEKMYQKNRTSYEDIQKTQTMSQLTVELSEIFKQSQLYSDPQLVTVLDALNQVTLKEEFYQYCSFLRVSVEVNIYRIDIFWELITAHYVSLANSKNSPQRVESTTTLSELILKGFSYLAKYYKLKPHHENEWKLAAEKREKLLKEQEEEVKKAFELAKQEEKERKMQLKAKEEEKLQKQEELKQLNAKKMEKQEEKSNKTSEKKELETKSTSEPQKQVVNKVQDEELKQKQLFKSLFESIDFNLDFDKDIPEDIQDEDDAFGAKLEQSDQVKKEQLQSETLNESHQQELEKVEEEEKKEEEEVTQPQQIIEDQPEPAKNDSDEQQLEQTKQVSAAEEKQEEEEKVEVIKEQEMPVFKHKIISKEKWNEDFWQSTLLYPWLELLAIRYSETKQIIVQFLLKLLQTCGHQVGSKGWDIVLKIIYEVSGEQTSVYAKDALKCLQHLINLYLGILDKQAINVVFSIIQNIRQNSQQLNVDFEFCEMLWHLGDFVSKDIDSQIYMVKILTQLKEFCVDENREVRHSSLHILSNLLQHNCQIYGPIFWQETFDQIFYPIMTDIINHFYEKLASNDRDAATWQYTAKTLVRSSTKLFKRYFTFDQECSQLLQQHFKTMATLLNQLQAELHQDVINSIKELFCLKPKEHQLEQSAFLDTLQYVRMVFTLVPDTVIYTKNLFSKAIPEVLQLITYLFQFYEPLPNIDSELYFKDIMSLYVRVINFPSLCLVTYSDLQVPSNIIQLFIEPLSEINKLLNKYQDAFYPHFSGLIQSILLIPPTDIFADQLLRLFLQQFIEQPQAHTELLQQIPSLMAHRWKSSYHRWYHSQKKLTNPIWQFAYEQLFELSVKILTAPPHRFEFVFSELLNNFSSCDVSLLQSYLSDKQLKLLLLMELKTLSFLYKKFANSPFAFQKIGTKHIQICERFSLVLYDMSQPEQLCFTGCEEINLALESFKLLVEMCHLTEGGKPEWRTYLDERCRQSVPIMLARAMSILKFVSKQTETQIQQKIFIQIMQLLNYVKIPKNSFPFKSEQGFIQQMNEGLKAKNSLLNNSNSGHLFYLFPYLTKAMELQNDRECRSAIREVLDKMYKEIQN